jgi:hypothetical protein
VLAVLWVAWASRTRPRADTHETVEAHQRFRDAFESGRDRTADRDAHRDSA